MGRKKRITDYLVHSHGERLFLTVAGSVVYFIFRREGRDNHDDDVNNMNQYAICNTYFKIPDESRQQTTL